MRQRTRPFSRAHLLALFLLGGGLAFAHAFPAAAADPEGFDPACLTTVCEVDSECCEGSWDGICEITAGQVCRRVSTPSLEPDAPGCVDGTCRAAVCAVDSFCCDTGWDQTCEQHAAKLCPTQDIKIAVILYNFQDSYSQPLDPDTVREMVFTATGTEETTASVNRWFKEVSDEEIRFVGANGNINGDVFGWYVLPRSIMYEGREYACDSAMVPEIEAQAVGEGFNRNNYDYVLYISNHAGCQASWKSDVNGIFAAALDRRDWRDYAHELGHAIGLLHARALNCADGGGNQIPLGGNCTYREYGDGYSTMGSHREFGHFSAGDKLRMGTWNIGDDVIQVTSTGTYELHPVTAPVCGGARGLRIQTPTNPDWAGGGKMWGSKHDDKMYLYIEHRANAGFNTKTQDYAQQFTGRDSSVIVHNGIDEQFSQYSFLLDMTPDTKSFSDTPMRPGEWYTDPSGRFTFRVREHSQTNDGALIDVIMNDGSYFYDPPPAWTQDLTAAQDDCSRISIPGQLDSDKDGMRDGCDNCKMDPNPEQMDTDQDGYGNVCDADLNNDGFTGLDDVLRILSTMQTLEEPAADINGDGYVLMDDVARALGMLNGGPGPSGLACAGKASCGGSL